MDDISSDSESDCFESANESLDENEEEDFKVKSKKYTRKSESKNKGPVSNENFKDENFVQNVKSDNSVTYRKRPERARTDSNKSPIKVTTLPKVINQSKSSHKTDVAADIFLQDLTSNFSKNINKSFSSLQQTSSNVKDLILNSLPISNVKEGTEFSYDDNSFEESIQTSDDHVEPFKIDEINVEKDKNYEHEKTKLCDKLNKSHEEERINVNKTDIEFSPNENVVIESENIDENIRLTNDNSDVKDNFDKEMLGCNNLENEKQQTESNQDLNRIIVENQTTIADTKNSDYSDSLNSDNAKEQLEQTFAEFHETLHKQKKNCVKLFTKEALNKTKINELLCNKEIEFHDTGNSLHGKKMADSSIPKLNNSNDLFMNYEKKEKKVEDSNDINMSKHNHLQPNTAQFKLFKNVEPLETFKSLDAFVGMFEKKSDISSAFDNRRLIDNLENNFFADKTVETFTKNENFSENKKETIKSEKDCLISDQFELQNEALTNNKKGKNEIIEVEKKVFFPENEYLEKLNQKKKKSQITNVVTETGSDLGESKCELPKTILENIMDKKEDVQFKEINSSLVKEGTDGWADDFSFSESEEDLEQSNDLCVSNEEALKEDVKNLEIKGKHLDTTSKISTDSLSTMSEEYQESDMEEIQENEAKGPIEDWDWDTWDDVDDPKESIVTNIVNNKTEVKKQESPDIERWSGWDTFGSKQSENQSNWGLWGVNMLLNKATAVTQGLSNVVEAGLGAPDPETLARMEKLERDSQKNDKKTKEIERQQISLEEKSVLKSIGTDNSMFPVFGLTNLVAGVTSKIVEHSKIQEVGSKVITGGLDTLESFGKKAMEVLQEGDPGLKNKRALLLGSNKPILSQVLKEAKEKAEKEIKQEKEKEMSKKCHFEGLFDDYQGMVHLEALEMLSTQSLLKLEQLRKSMTDEEKDDLKEVLEEVEQLCYLEEYDIRKNDSVVDFKFSLTLAVESLKNEISLKKMIEIQEEVNKWLENSIEIKPSPILVHQKVVITLAQLAAATIHQFHKAGELLSVKECRKTVEEIEALSKFLAKLSYIPRIGNHPRVVSARKRMTNVICNEINRVCERFIKLSENLFRGTGDINLLNEKINSVMTDSTSYIKQAFNLLIPVLQVGAAA